MLKLILIQIPIRSIYLFSLLGYQETLSIWGRARFLHLFALDFRCLAANLQVGGEILEFWHHKLPLFKILPLESTCFHWYC